MTTTYQVHDVRTTARRIVRTGFASRAAARAWLDAQPQRRYLVTARVTL